MNYQTGEVSYDYIASKLGKSHTAASNFVFSAQQKIKRLTHDTNLAEMPEEQVVDVVSYIFNKRKEASQYFVEFLHDHVENSIVEFFDLLNQQNYISYNQIETLSEREIESLIGLRTYNDKEYSKQVLIDDIEHEDNLFKSFQYFISRIV